jgi:hypothetical protein
MSFVETSFSDFKYNHYFQSHNNGKTVDLKEVGPSGRSLGH